MTSLRYFGAFFGLSSAILTYLLVRMPQWLSGRRPLLLWSLALGVSGYGAWSLTGQTAELCGLLGLAAVVVAVVRRMMPDVTLTGQGLVLAAVAMAIGLSSWSMELTLGFGWPAWLQGLALLLQGAVCVFIFLPTTLFQVLSFGELGLRQTRRDEAYARLAAAQPLAHQPRVCLQVPCYSEPPELVMATLDAIARLDYANFEVMVIDNNTKDPALWRPVQAHCARLGERFRFFHVDELSGAKAGALNHLTPHLRADVELLSIVDADYIVEPDFLKRWVALFEDRQVGFVQTTHEYRDWEHSPFLARFYPGYIYAHKLLFPALTQIGAELIVGTMCMVRRSALEEVGGWAQWCQTEDSELSVRLHAHGYKGYYFADACGRGLMPETLDRMRKQRFRWAYGPMQQLRRHWRLYLGLTKGRLTLMQRYFELARGLEYIPGVTLAFVYLPVCVMAYREVFGGAMTHVAMDCLLFQLAAVAKRRLSILTNLRQVGRHGWLDALLSPVAEAAIKVYEIKGALCALLGVRWPWQRTDKFPVTGSLRKAVAVTRVDRWLSAGCWLLAAALYPSANFVPFNYTALLCTVLVATGFCFLFSTGLCLLHEIDLKRRHRQPAFTVPGHEALAVGPVDA